jgi:hypothetical protein
LLLLSCAAAAVAKNATAAKAEMLSALIIECLPPGHPKLSETRAKQPSSDEFAEYRAVEWVHHQSRERELWS